MQQSVPPDVARVFTELADLVYSGVHPQEALDAVVRITAQVVPGADHVSISTLENGAQLRTLAATDDIARMMDQLESEAQQGPCLDSIVKESVQRDDDIAVMTTWPALAKLTLERTPVRGMLGYRLMNGAQGRAALNVFSDTPGALTLQSADIGAMLAAFTSVALTAVEARASAESLRHGLESNREIGKAIGLLMASHDVDDAEAFEILRVTSNATNVRLAELAARITASRRHQEE
jgi:hypothetical protein